MRLFQASNVLKKKASESRLAVGSRELSRQGSSDADSSYSVDEGTCAKEADPIKVLSQFQIKTLNIG